MYEGEIRPTATLILLFFLILDLVNWAFELVALDVDNNTAKSMFDSDDNET